MSIYIHMYLFIYIDTYTIIAYLSECLRVYLFVHLLVFVDLFIVAILSVVC